MKRIILIIFTYVLVYTLNAQNNPYEMFGHKSDLKYEMPITEYLYIINSVDSSEIKAIAILSEKNIVVVYNQQDSVIASVKIKPDELLRFISIDPAAAEYPNISPYAYVANNPLIFIDPDGRNPVYARTGELLGTDDNGIQGDAIIMDQDNFKQGMSYDDAMGFNLGIAGLENQDAIDSYNTSFEGLKDRRPDWDGYLTLDEANEWYRNGNGEPLFTDLSKIDLSGIYSLGESYVGQVKTFNLLLNSGSINDGLVYGQVTLKRYPNHSVRAYADEYNFEMHNGWNPLNWPRNAQTVIGGAYAGDGQKYEINMYGSQQLTPILPWIK